MIRKDLGFGVQIEKNVTAIGLCLHLELRESTFKIRKVNLAHTFEGNFEGRNRSADPRYVVDVVKDKLKHSAKKVIPKPRQIKEDFKVSHMTNIPYYTA